MKFSVLKVVLWVLLIPCIPVYTQPQTRQAKKPVSSISGKVTIKGKAAPGIIVVLRSDSSDQRWVTQKDATDQEGNYRITNVPPGTYQVMPAAQAFVLTSDPNGKSLLIAESENVEGIDFALARGGAITGKATDSEDRPLIEESISLIPADANNAAGAALTLPQGRVQTDDRGIYRIFGIPQGKYKVALGQGEDGSFDGRPRRSHYKQTFHPAVTDFSKATAIEVTEGSEASNVDISVSRTILTFSVSGRIVDGETQRALPNVTLSLRRIEGRNHSSVSTSSSSDSKGEFKLDNLTPGKYSIFVLPQVNSEISAEAVPFDLIDQDVSGLLVKASQGASMSGVLVFEGTNDKSALARLSQIRLHTYVVNDGISSWGRSGTVNPDGGFRIGGLQSGAAHFALGSTAQSAQGVRNRARRT